MKEKIEGSREIFTDEVICWVFKNNGGLPCARGAPGRMMVRVVYPSREKHFLKNHCWCLQLPVQDDSEKMAKI